MLRTCHLFAGAGGGLLADLILGHTPVVAVEWDAYCCQVLRERAADEWFPGLHVHEGDVRLFDPSEYAGRVDCIHAGFPCTDVSVAGARAGLGEGTRSGLYREVLRIAGAIRPRYLFLENVAAIVPLLGTVLGDLAALGYDCRWLCLRASAVGAPHHRDRWWCLADASGRRCGGSLARQDQQSRGAEVVGSSENVAHPNCTLRKGLFITVGAYPEYTESGGSCWWGTEPDVGRVADGVAARFHRVKALGNGQVPLQAAAAWTLLGGP